jgi:serine protease AprX
MIRRTALNFFAAMLLGIVMFAAANAAALSPTLKAQLGSAADDASVGVVIVSFNTKTGLGDSHFNVLRSLGVTKGFTLQHLGMVAFPATAGQVRALAANSAVRSVWSNDRLFYFDNETSTLTGVSRVRTDANFTRLNGGLPVSGSGNFSVVINDSGIDARHDDLKLGSKVIQNVLILTDTSTLSGFTPLLVQENLPVTDTSSGHGTHCAGIVGGTGQDSGGLYAGVAPGAKLIGTGSGAVLFILNALGGFEYSLANQALYGIRVISNSYGSSGAFDPNDPINIATQQAHDQNIIVVFAAGNSGPGKDTMNPYAKAPWVIGVAAGTKEGGLASFSSRGTPKSERLSNSDPNDDYNAPTITAPGTGREFASDAGKFTSDVVSTRALTNAAENGLVSQADLELPTAYLPFYTEISGTSMATPFVAGTVALMLSADPTLTPDQVKQIIVDTATQMPGYKEFEVGAGYINVYAAVDKVFNRSKTYGTYRGALDERQYNAQYTITGPAPQQVHVDYNPAALPGPGSSNSFNINVQPGMSVLDIFAAIGNDLQGAADGNTIGILATDPKGNKYSSGIALPILDAPSREIVVNNPIAGNWLVEVRGVRGLAAAPQVSLPTSGAALPGPVDFTITQRRFNLAPIADIQGHPAQQQIETAIKNRMMDTLSDGLFHPDSSVTREDLARLLVLNTALRQTLGVTQKFTDVTGDLAAIAEAVTTKASTNRDYVTAENASAPTALMSASGTTFNPSGTVSRLDVAVALVKALGQDAQAKALAGSNVTATYNGTTVVVDDNASIPSALRGYVQIAINDGILQATFSFTQGPYDLQPTLHASVNPNNPTTRAFMAYALANYRQHFVAGS